MQLNKYLASCGVASRRKANFAILQGRVSINDAPVEKLGVTVDADKDRVMLDGALLKYPEAYQYFLLNKPGDVVTTALDGRGRRTVLDLINTDARIFPIGRLDMDTEGVLLLTNDGDLAFRLTHPKFEIEKIYEAVVEGDVQESAIQRLAEGIAINPGVVVTGEAKVLRRQPGKTRVEIRLHEGKKRQIRRMMKAVGHPVYYLRRMVFAGLTTVGVNPGKWRKLTDAEVTDLYRMVGLEQEH